MNGYVCPCGMWLSTSRIQAIHNRPVSKDGRTSSEHKEMMEVKQLHDLEMTVEDVRHE